MGATEKKFWSEYASDARLPYCKGYAPLPRATTSGRMATPRSSVVQDRRFKFRDKLCVFDSVVVSNSLVFPI